MLFNNSLLEKMKKNIKKIVETIFPNHFQRRYKYIGHHILLSNLRNRTGHDGWTQATRFELLYSHLRSNAKDTHRSHLVNFVTLLTYICIRLTKYIMYPHTLPHTHSLFNSGPNESMENVPIIVFNLYRIS